MLFWCDCMYACQLTSKVKFDAAGKFSSLIGKFWGIICYILSKNKKVTADKRAKLDFWLPFGLSIAHGLFYTKKTKKTVIEKKLWQILTNKWNCAPLALQAFILHNRFLEICIGTADKRVKLDFWLPFGLSTAPWAFLHKKQKNGHRKKTMADID